jgi:hypothetical protein
VKLGFREKVAKLGLKEKAEKLGFKVWCKGGLICLWFCMGVVLLYGLNVKVMWWCLEFFIFGVWEATIVAFVKLVHSSTCLCVFGGEAV